MYILKRYWNGSYWISKFSARNLKRHIEELECTDSFLDYYTVERIDSDNNLVETLPLDIFSMRMLAKWDGFPKWKRVGKRRGVLKWIPNLKVMKNRSIPEYCFPNGNDV